MRSATAKRPLQRQLEALDARIAELESSPVREGRYEYRETGQTYRQEWQGLDAAGKAAKLAKSGITLAVGLQIDGPRSKYNAGAFRYQIRVPGDWPEPALTDEDRALRDALARGGGVNIGPDGDIQVATGMPSTNDRPRN
jgi:hypothetical protein